MEKLASGAESIDTRVRRVIAEALRVPLDRVGLDATLEQEGLGVDSLGLIKINVLLEERFDITIPDFTEIEGATPRTVREVVELVAGRVGGAS
jgi:acyl carrier protein